MEGKKSIIRVFAIIIIGAGFLSVTIFAANKTCSAAEFRTLIGFPGGGKASYDVGPHGCIQKFYYETDKHKGIYKGKPIPSKRPSWLKEDREWVEFGSFTDIRCRQGYIGIRIKKGTPTEYWGWANGYYYCIGAYDPSCPAWYQPCRDTYPNCD